MAKTNCSLDNNFKLKLVTTLHQKYKCHVRKQCYYCLRALQKTRLPLVLVDSARSFCGLRVEKHCTNQLQSKNAARFETTLTIAKQSTSTRMLLMN